ncbi:hypothetical protein HCC30_25725 [Streptomyces sp. HNM0574]|nr:DUF6343 family protein [Streptomyces sp. HNM0574]NLU70630.1 hypothetical protein [Streptomyces sp. HNM0574]
MRNRRGSEPVTARSDLRLRQLLATVFVPLFVAGTALFWYWMTQTGPGDVPSEGSLRVLTVVCGLLALFAAVDLAVVLRRRRRGDDARDERERQRRTPRARR